MLIIAVVKGLIMTAIFALVVDKVGEKIYFAMQIAAFIMVILGLKTGRYITQ